MDLIFCLKKFVKCLQDDKLKFLINFKSNIVGDIVLKGNVFSLKKYERLKHYKL